MTEQTKHCCTCSRDLPTAEFNRRGSAHDGLQSRCRECCSSWYADNRVSHMENVRRRSVRARRVLQQHVATYLRDHPCIDCGEDDLRCLEFDHQDPALKLNEVSKLVSLALPWKRVLAEIDKCDVRCANCHRRVTVERGGWWRQAVHDSDRAERAVVAGERLERILPAR